jgi:hypothetical protein
MVGGELLTPVLLGRPHVDEGGRVELGKHLVAQRSDLAVLRPGYREAGRRDLRSVGGQLAALQLPLLAAAVQELHVLEAAELQDPVGIGGEPVVVPAVQDHGGVVADSGARQQLRDAGLVDVIAADRRMQVRGPVPPDRPSDVTLLVRARVLVDLDDADRRIIQMLLEPVRFDECARVGVSSHGFLLLPSSPGQFRC